MIRTAFTMIELIFVIIIIGILAAMAIPRLNVVRDDAKLVKDVSNMSICIQDAGNYYTATGINLDENGSQACASVACYTITYDTNESNFTVAAKLDGASYCPYINEIGGHLIGTHIFRGEGIKF